MKSIKNALIIGSLISISNAALAINVDKMIDACIKQGELQGVCKCAVNKWSDSITSGESAEAKIIYDMMVADKQPSANAMSQLMSLLTRYRDYGMECAMNAPAEPEENAVDISDFLPKGAISDEDAASLKAIMSGKGDMMANLKAMSDRDDNRREKEREERREQQQKRDAEIATLRKELKAEEARLEKTPALSKSVDDYEKLVRMRAKLYGDGSEDIDCLWNTLKQTAGNDKAGILATYFVAVGGGDFDQPPEHKPYMSDAYKKYETYMSSRDKCY